jgi:hypothetical protein
MQQRKAAETGDPSIVSAIVGEATGLINDVAQVGLILKRILAQADARLRDDQVPGFVREGEVVTVIAA